MSNKLEIIAGPCSVSEKNAAQIKEIATLDAIFGVRVVGLKSRTELFKETSKMGMDLDSYNDILEEIVDNGSVDFTDYTFPSIYIAKEVLGINKNIKIATEVVDSVIQMPVLANHIGHSLFPWNPSVNQIGWQMRVMGAYAAKYNFSVGIKNGKNLGISIHDSEHNNISAPLESTWIGLSKYTQLGSENTVFIHRGVDDPEKGNLRNAIIHECAKRVKNKTNSKIYFDPSHIFGPKMRDDIVQESLKAMQIKTQTGEFLYDGVLIECGDSTTDTNQHITIDELSNFIDEVSHFRNI